MLFRCCCHSFGLPASNVEKVSNIVLIAIDLGDDADIAIWAVEAVGCKQKCSSKVCNMHLPITSHAEKSFSKNCIQSATYPMSSAGCTSR